MQGHQFLQLLLQHHLFLPLQMKNLPERSTRGVRQRNLQGAAMEADIQFWNQDYFKEISDDDDFSDSHGII